TTTAAGSLPVDADRTQFGEHFFDEQVDRLGGGGTLGTERGSNDHEPFDTELREGQQSFDAVLRWTHDAEAVDEFWSEGRRLRRSGARVLADGVRVVQSRQGCGPACEQRP